MRGYNILKLKRYFSLKQFLATIFVMLILYCTKLEEPPILDENKVFIVEILQIFLMKYEIYFDWFNFKFLLFISSQINILE